MRLLHPSNYLPETSTLSPHQQLDGRDAASKRMDNTSGTRFAGINLSTFTEGEFSGCHLRLRVLSLADRGPRVVAEDSEVVR